MENISKVPQYLGAILAQLLNFKELLLGFILMKTCSPTWNSFSVHLRSAWLLCLSCEFFKLPRTCFMVNSIFFNNSGSSINLITWLLLEMAVLDFLIDVFLGIPFTITVSPSLFKEVKVLSKQFNTTQ